MVKQNWRWNHFRLISTIFSTLTYGRWPLCFLNTSASVLFFCFLWQELIMRARCLKQFYLKNLKITGATTNILPGPLPFRLFRDRRAAVLRIDVLHSHLIPPSIAISRCLNIRFVCSFRVSIDFTAFDSRTPTSNGRQSWSHPRQALRPELAIYCGDHQAVRIDAAETHHSAIIYIAFSSSKI